MNMLMIDVAMTATLVLTLLINLSVDRVDSAKGAPPQIDEGVRRHFRIAVGTKPFKLSCPVVGGDADGSIIVKWTKDEEELTASDWDGGGGGAQLPYRLLNWNRDLKIRNPQMADSGIYTCMAINGFGHRKVEFTLEVYDPNTLRGSDEVRLGDTIELSEYGSAPVWRDREAVDRVVKTPIKVWRGAKLELRCPAAGNPLPKVYWSRDGVPINIELMNSKSARFTMNNVNRSDSGVYTCRLENAHGSLEADFRVIVVDDADAASLDGIIGAGGMESVSSSADVPTPTIDQQPYNSTVRVGHTAQFQCRVHWSKEQPTIRWLRKIENPAALRAAQPNATILHINHMHLLVIEQLPEDQQHHHPNSPSGNNQSGNNSNRAAAFVNTLTIPSVHAGDAGRYFCVVTNSAGQFVYRSAYLVVAIGNKFSPFANPANVIIATIVAFTLTAVTMAVIWLCCNSAGSGGTGSALLSGEAPSIPSKSAAPSLGTQPFIGSASTSTSSSTSSMTSASAAAANCTSSGGGTLNAPPNSLATAGSGNGSVVPNIIGHNNVTMTAGSTLVPIGNSTLSTTNSANGMAPPPPPPSIPVPQPIIPGNFQQQQPICSPSDFQQQQLGYLIAQQQHQGYYTNQIPADHQFDVSSPLLFHRSGGNFVGAPPVTDVAGFAMNGGGGGADHLLYLQQHQSLATTLDRRYFNNNNGGHYRFGGPNIVQQQLQQHSLHRTKVGAPAATDEDQLSRISSHIYDKMASSSDVTSASGWQNNLRTKDGWNNFDDSLLINGQRHRRPPPAPAPLPPPQTTPTAMPRQCCDHNQNDIVMTLQPFRSAFSPNAPLLRKGDLNSSRGRSPSQRSPSARVTFVEVDNSTNKRLDSDKCGSLRRHISA